MQQLQERLEFPTFLQQRWCWTAQGCSAPLEPAATGGKTAAKENAQQERLGVETALCLLQEKQNSTKRSTKRSSVLLVFSKPKRMQNGEVYDAVERRVCLLFLYKNYRLDISNMS